MESEAFHRKNRKVSLETHLRLIIEKFERKLESYGVKFPVDGAYKDTGIEDMGADAISQLHIRIEVRHKEYAPIQSFLLNHPQPTVEGTQQDEW